MTRHSLNPVDVAANSRMTRRRLAGALPAIGLAAVLGPRVARADDAAADVDFPADVVPVSFPRQAEDVVLEIVRVSHFDLERVRELVEARPALARASWDWGFGDWESAIGAASHTGRREIADVLLEHGARPTVFTAAMMGWLDMVKAAVAARPGIQRETGPHGITLLAHARFGGEKAAPVAAWLAELGDADPEPSWGEFDHEPYLGTYVFGAGDADRLEVVTNRRGQLTVQRPGQVNRPLIPVAEHRFHPMGVPSVRLEFTIENASASGLTIVDAALRLHAVRAADLR